jgi:hypothetical protein
LHDDEAQEISAAGRGNKHSANKREAVDAVPCTAAIRKR